MFVSKITNASKFVDGLFGTQHRGLHGIDGNLYRNTMRSHRPREAIERIFICMSNDDRAMKLCFEEWIATFHNLISKEKRMFKKYPDQETDRRLVLWTGFTCIVVGLLFLVGGLLEVSLFFLVLGFVYVAIAIFCTHEGFKTAMRIGNFSQWFS